MLGRPALCESTEVTSIETTPHLHARVHRSDVTTSGVCEDGAVGGNKWSVAITGCGDDEAVGGGGVKIAG